MQEPGANGTEILNTIKYVRPGKGFVPKFPLFHKIEVNGKDEHPMYTFLKSKCPSTRKGFASKASLVYEPLHVDDIRWNFEKILVDRRGRPVLRYDPRVDPVEFTRDISHLVAMSYDSQQAMHG